MWQKQKRGLHKKFTFSNFAEAFAFIEQVADIAEKADHHPEIHNNYNVVELWLSTHSEGGKVTEKDEDLAKSIDLLTQTPKKAPAKKVTHHSLKLFADGGSRGNPGPSATGYVLYDMDDNVVEKNGSYLGLTTNNQAEYQAVKQGLQAAKRHGAREVDVYLDSLLVVNQMKGIFKIKNRDLWPIYQAIKKQTEHFKKIVFTHVPREMNKAADGEVNKVLDGRANL